jgi:hypothetical protein
MRSRTARTLLSSQRAGLQVRNKTGGIFMNIGAAICISVIGLVLIFCVVKIEQNTRETSQKLTEVLRELKTITKNQDKSE